MLQSHGLAGRRAKRLLDGCEITSDGGAVLRREVELASTETPEQNIALFHGARLMQLADALRRGAR